MLLRRFITRIIFLLELLQVHRKSEAVRFLLVFVKLFGTDPRRRERRRFIKLFVVYVITSVIVVLPNARIEPVAPQDFVAHVRGLTL